MKKVKKHKSTRIHIIGSISGVIVLTMTIIFIILCELNQRNSYKITNMLAMQVEALIADNRITVEKELANAMKDYSVRAEAVSYVLNSKSIEELEPEELLQVKNFAQVDEISFIAPDGEVFLGTNAEYIGKNIADIDKLSDFVSMLDETDKTVTLTSSYNDYLFGDAVYSLNWNENADYLILIGIATERLKEQLSANEISVVIGDVPSYEGVTIYVADKDTEVIAGSTDPSVMGKSLKDMGLFHTSINQGESCDNNATIGGYRHYCSYRMIEDYVLVVTLSTKDSIDNFLIITLVEAIYMIGSGIAIYQMLQRLFVANEERDRQLSILVSMSEIYYNMHLINIPKNTFVEYRANEIIKNLADDEADARGVIVKVMNDRSLPEHKDMMLEFVNLDTLPERMYGKKMISREYLTVTNRWYEASFISIENDEDGRPIQVIFSNRCIDEVKEREERLLRQSNTDELTGFLNRRAYEDDINAHEDYAAEDNFVYISLDVNGLKVANDTLGHAAGDELLMGACECMRQCFGPYGRLYRTGGDEFAAIIFVDITKLPSIINDFDDTLEKWRGKLIDAVSVSYGYVAAGEVEYKSVRKIANIADKRMYDSKSAFYRRKGMDRRGQMDAHIALCSLYTKILKINITEDSYQIVNMREGEQTYDMGFSDRISEWIYEFGRRGHVHPEDLENYLSLTNINYMSGYFLRKKSALHIFYRRKIDGVYKQVMMEIIPANDYSDDNQSLYLYVKNIDKL